jgi:hypothetical protein
MLIEVALMVALSHHGGSVPVYHVRSGDTLTDVAEKQCHGQPDRWTGIYAASRARHWTARNANLITVGQKLAIDCQYVPSQLTYASQPLYRPSSGTGGSVYVRTGAHRSHRSYHGRNRHSYQGGSYHGSGSFEQCVIARESGGNARAVNPSSQAGGLYQFLPSSWRALGYSGRPQDAPVSVQRQAFQKAYAQSGTSPWSPYDGC